MSGLERTTGDAITAISSMHESAAWNEFDTSTMNCDRADHTRGAAQASPMVCDGRAGWTTSELRLLG